MPKALVAEGHLEAVPALPELGAFGPTLAPFVLVTYEHRLAGVRRLSGRMVGLEFPNRWLVSTLLLSPVIVFASLAMAVATGTTPAFPWTGPRSRSRSSSCWAGLSRRRSGGEATSSTASRNG